MLINGVDINIELTRTPEAFYLLASTDDTNVRIKILDATVFFHSSRIETLSLLSSSQCLGYEA